MEQPVTALSWQEEAAELLVQLGSITLHDLNLLPAALIGVELGLRTADLAARWASCDSLPGIIMVCLAVRLLNCMATLSLSGGIRTPNCMHPGGG